MSIGPEQGQHRYFLTLYAAFHHQPTYKGLTYEGDVLEKRGIELTLNAAAYNLENPGQYDPDYHRRLVQARLNDFQLLGLDSDVVASIADRELIWGKGFKVMEEQLFRIIQEVPFKWREPLPEEPPAFGTELFNRYAKHPMVLPAILESLNREEYKRACNQEPELRIHLENPFIKDRYDFTILAKHAFESWFVQNGLKIPDSGVIEADYEISKLPAPATDEKEAFEAFEEKDKVEPSLKVEQPDYIFHWFNGFWKIKFGEGAMFYLEAKMLGFYYIRILLASPKEGITNIDLYRNLDSGMYEPGLVEPSAEQTFLRSEKISGKHENTDVHQVTTPRELIEEPSEYSPKKSRTTTSDEIRDPTYNEQVKAQLRELEKIMDEADREGDNEKFNRAKNVYDDIIAQTKKDTYKKRSKKLTKEKVYAHHNVQRAIKGAYKKIAKVDEKLHKHLDEHINFSVETTCYGEKLDKPPAWLT